MTELLHHMTFRTPKKISRSPQKTLNPSENLLNNPKIIKNKLVYKSKSKAFREENCYVKNEYLNNYNNNNNNRLLESPFCKLLNESEREPFEKYQ